MHIRERHEWLQAIQRANNRAGTGWSHQSVIGHLGGVEGMMQNKRRWIQDRLEDAVDDGGVRGIMSRVVTRNKHTEREHRFIADGERSD